MNAVGSDVAIIGMACVFPGAPDLATYWRNIVAKVDAVGDPPEEWSFAPPGEPDLAGEGQTLYTRRGGYLKDLARFDPLAYGVMPTSVSGGEPDQFLALRVAHEALADAGCLDRSRDRATVEVILGKGTPVNPGHTNLLQHCMMVDQTLRIIRALHPEHTDAELSEIRRQLTASLPPLNAETMPALVPNIVTGRIANRLDLMGVNYTIDAACASSLIAVERGMEDLRAGKCDLALVGGVQGSTPPPVLFAFCKLGALSRSGNIRPFDKDADGTLLGEGLGMVVLKRREDAERDDDRIYALLKGMGSASDGRAVGLLAPRLEGEALALRRAYQATGISPDSVELIEAHGTGTLVGDATEVRALRQVFGARNGSGPRCALGTVKSMISHLIPAAGIAGLIKIALALHHRVLPPTLHCEKPSPALELGQTPFYINTEARPWIHGDATPRRAGVNAFGFGGINAHAILEEHIGPDGQDVGTMLDQWDTEVVVLQAHSRQELLADGERLLSFLSRQPAVALRDLAFTLNCPQTAAPARLAIVAGSVSDLRRKLTGSLQRLMDPARHVIKDRNGIFYFEQPLADRVAFLFPGEGSQYPDMLADLCLHFPEVRMAFDRADRILGVGSGGSRLRHVVFPPPGSPAPDPAVALSEMDLALSSVFAADHALLALLERLDIRPTAVVGHSSGEFAALLAAGAIAVTDEAQLVQQGRALRSVYEQVAHEMAPAALLTVGGADPGVVEAVLDTTDGPLHLAMDNCPHQVVLCGSEEAVQRAQRRLQEQGAICGRLPFDRPYHTPLFQLAADGLASFYEGLRFAAPETAVYSCATADRYPDDPSRIAELAFGQWARPVRFRETVEAMYGAGHRIFLEVGAKGTLTGFVDDILGSRPHLAVTADRPGRSGTTSLNHLVALLAANGVPMRLDRLYERRRPRRVELDGEVPTVPPTREMRLVLGLPRMRLTAASADVRHPSASDDVARAEMPLVPTAAPLTTTSAASRKHVSQSLGNGTAEAMTTYFRTMERFLDCERQVIAALGVRTSTPPPDLQGRVSEAFPIRISYLDTGRAVVGTCRLDPAVHTYLRDHTLGRPPSFRDPGLTALPVVPLTVSMEILAQVAALLSPGQRLIGMRAVRAPGWIEMESGPRVLGVTATRTGPGEGIVARILDAEPGERAGSVEGRVLVEATVLFAGTHPPPPPPMPAQATADPYPRDHADYYQIMFHGPVFHSVARIEGYGTEGIEATLRVPVNARLLPEVSQGLHIDPVLIDGAIQLVGFWTWDRLDRGFCLFPIGFDALDIYGPFPVAGTSVGCRTRISLGHEGRIVADTDLIGPDGAVLARMTGGAYHRLFDWTRRFAMFAMAPQHRMLSVPWPAPVAGLGDATRCCRILRSEAGASSWPRILVSLILGAHERATWSRMTGSDAGRREWLLGRLVAKDAIRLFLADRHGIRLAAADIEIEADGHGRPCVAESLQRRLGVTVAISISHTRGDAVAIAADGGDKRGIGIDLERVGEMPKGFAEAALAPSERQLLDLVPAESLPVWVLRLWCAKEAAATALGAGLAETPRNLVVRGLDARGGEVWLDGDPRLTGRQTSLNARTGCEDGLVFATSVA